MNTIVGSGDPSHDREIREWKMRGGRWIVECPVPGLRGNPISAEHAYAVWASNPGLADAKLDGIIVDEFGTGKTFLARYPLWIQAVERIAHEFGETKVFYPYCSSMYAEEESTNFVRRVIDLGYKFAWERYLKEKPSEKEARFFLEEKLSSEAREWRKKIAGSVEKMILCLGCFSAPPETLDTNPSVDWKVWMDMQFNHIANSPDFRGLYGIMEYTSGYADEETIRWTGKLYRHYCIEGRKDRATSDPYVLRHLDNPDFRDGARGWKISPGEDGSIKADSFRGYGWLQGRYPRGEEGDTFLRVRRSKKAPNVFSQNILNLNPAKRYTLRFYTADYGDLVRGISMEKRHVVSYRIKAAQIIWNFQHSYASCHDLEPFVGDHRFWMNFHYAVFQPDGREAELEIMDWQTATNPGGKVGQELAFNFIKVQPYLDQDL